MKNYELVATTMREFLADPASASWEPVGFVTDNEVEACNQRVQLMSINPHLYIKMICRP